MPTAGVCSDSFLLQRPSIPRGLESAHLPLGIFMSPAASLWPAGIISLVHQGVRIQSQS